MPQVTRSSMPDSRSGSDFLNRGKNQETMFANHSVCGRRTDADGGDAEADMVFVAATDRKVVSAFESIGQMRTIDRSMYGRMDAILPRGAPHSSLGRVSRSATHASGFQCSCSCSFLGKFVEDISQGLNVHNVAKMGFFKSNETLL